MLYPFPLLLYHIKNDFFIIISFEEYEQWDETLRNDYTHTIPDSFITGYVSETISTYLINLMLMDITSLDFKEKSGPLYLTFKALFFKNKVPQDDFTLNIDKDDFGISLLNLIIQYKKSKIIPDIIIKSDTNYNPELVSDLTRDIESWITLYNFDV